MIKVRTTNHNCPHCGNRCHLLVDPDCPPIFYCPNCGYSEKVKPEALVIFEPIEPIYKSRLTEWINIKIRPGTYIVRATSESSVQVQSLPDEFITASNLRHQADHLKEKLEQREKFIDDIFAELKNSNSKSTIVNVLLTRCKEQINGQKLGVL